MLNVEVNGNLENEPELNYRMFYDTTIKVLELYVNEFINEFDNSIGLLIDNATSGTGYTPIITPALGKYLIIKLGIGKNDPESKIAYQLSHELMHYIFYVTKGIDKAMADINEESICSAASLIVIKKLYLPEFESYNEYTKSLDDEAYRRGAEVALSTDYDFNKLKKLI